MAVRSLVFAWLLALPSVLAQGVEGGLAPAPDQIVKLALSVSEADVAPDQSATFEVRAAFTIGGDYHIYGLDGTFKNENIPDGTVFRVDLGSSGRLSLVGQPVPSRVPSLKDDEFAGRYPYFEREITFIQKLKVTGFDPKAPLEFDVTLAWMACNDSGCLPPKSVTQRLKTPESIRDVGSVGGDLQTDPRRASEGGGVGVPGVAQEADFDDFGAPGSPTARPLGQGADPAAAISARVVGERLRPGETVEIALRGPAELLAAAAGLGRDAVVFLNAPIGLAGPIRFEGGELRLPITTVGADVAETVHAYKGRILLPGGERLEFSGNIDIRSSILGFLLIAAGAALLALLTPCVFPMIPITISFFTKQAEQSSVSPKVMGLVYAAGIVGSFTAIGAIFTSWLGASGATDFATHPITLGFIATLFIVFALSLFGAFEIQLPAGAMKLVGGAQGKGGLIGVLLLGTLFAVTTFTCTAPFVGALLAGAVASGEWTRPVLGMVAFSGVLALPFLFLSIFPSKLKSLPKSGGWLNEVKVIMGFIELMAAFKFLGDMGGVLQTDFFSRFVVLLVWIACFVAMGLYVLGVFRLPKDAPKAKASVLSLIVALFCFVSALGLAPGLSGELLHREIEAYLPKEKEERTPEGREAALVAAILREVRGLNLAAGGEETAELPEPGAEKKHFAHEHINDLAGAIAEAKALGRPLFIDFTGYSCPNCRLVEKYTFRRPEVKRVVDQQFVVATLFTDGKGDAAFEAQQGEHQALLQRIARTVANPYYVVMDPATQDVLGSRGFERSYLSDPGLFATWLKDLHARYELLR